MRSLYWRIFLSIALTMAVVVAASILIAFRAIGQWAEVMERVDARGLAAEARQQLADGGETGLRRWLTDAESAYPAVRLYVIDGEGKELLGRTPPERMMWRGLTKPPSRPFSGRLGPVEELVGPDGSLYRLLITPRRPGPFGVLGAPDARWGILLAALLIVAAASFLLARSFSRPVHRLRDVTRALAAGDLSARTVAAVSSRRDEMGLLARDFDNMAERLQRLADARQELIRNVSHELRTPLTRIQVAVELARRKGSGADTELARIATETGKLDELIGQLMDLTRLDDPKIEMGRETFDLADLLDHVVAAAEIEAGAKGVAIDWSKPEPLPVEADAALLGSAIENVLRNAIRFSPGGGAVTVRLAAPETDAAGQMARIRIADHGPGVPDSELEAIFDPFHQVDRARSPDRGGKGLGLAIAAGVIRRHGGRIEASNREDGGLQVRILIPARAAD